MNRTEVRHEADAVRFYADLKEVCSLRSSCRVAYERLGEVFREVVQLGADEAGVSFGGLFAQTDFVLKRAFTSVEIRRLVHGARSRLRTLSMLSDEFLEASLLGDVWAVCALVEVVCRVPMPLALRAMLPVDQSGDLSGEKNCGLRSVSESMRVVVDRFAEGLIYATADSADASEVVVHCAGSMGYGAYADWDWSYLMPLLRRGCQLNLVRVREVGGVLYPELIIYEPDYLVDVSSVANCFEAYGATAQNYVLSRLRPSVESEAVVLGNLASRFLDEELRGDGQMQGYSESVHRFFNEQALSLIGTDISADFHRQARLQQSNIHHVVFDILPQALPDGRFDRREVVVEPTFFCEMLGLQGRMDFLQLDFSLLIEQKAGRAAFPEAVPLRQQQRHYVQLLLYMLMVRYGFRSRYERNGNTLQAFLLYSKYREGLLSVSFAPQLVFDAVRMRNEIACGVFERCIKGWGDVCALTAEGLNVQGLRGRLWEEFMRPQIEALLRPLHEADGLSRSYFLRMVQFVETEQLVAKVGGGMRGDGGFAARWHTSVAERVREGSLCCGLRMAEPRADEWRTVDSVLLVGGEEQLEMGDFREGDVVVFYAYSAGTDPDVRRTMAFRATVASLNGGWQLSLRNAQVAAHVFWAEGERLWAVEHDLFESSFAPLYRGLQMFLQAPRSRRELLLLGRAPMVDEERTLRGSYGAMDEMVLRMKRARELFLIVGPPGTGKTSFGLLYAVQEELCEADGRVLLLAYTNRAVDEICDRLEGAGIDYVRVGNRFSCAPAFRDRLVDSLAIRCGSVGGLRKAFVSQRVVVGTASAFNSRGEVLRLGGFSLAVVDEASQLLEPQLMGILCATLADGQPAVGRVVMIGDHKQLSAVVQQSEAQSVVVEEELRAVGLTDCRLSLFERLLRRYRDRAEVVFMLTRQGRMHEEVADFPNREFYGGKLYEVPLAHQCGPLPSRIVVGGGLDMLLTTKRVAFIEIRADEGLARADSNPAEARALVATAQRWVAMHREEFDGRRSLGIIVPYRSQVAEVRRQLKLCSDPLLEEVMVDTVERFQGSQRDCILYGFTASRPAQLSFLQSTTFVDEGLMIDRKLNVAMTRARQQLLLFGDSRLLCRAPVFARLVDYMRSHGAVVDVGTERYVNGDF